MSEGRGIRKGGGGGTARMYSIACTFQYLLGKFNEKLFPEHWWRKHRRKKNQVRKL